MCLVKSPLMTNTIAFGELVKMPVNTFIRYFPAPPSSVTDVTLYCERIVGPLTINSIVTVNGTLTVV